MELEFDLLDKDYTRISKSELVAILNRHNLVCTEQEENVESLRLVIRILRGALRRCISQPEVSELVKQLLENRRLLSDEEKGRFLELGLLEDEFLRRQRIYDEPPNEEEIVGPRYQNSRDSAGQRGADHEYEDVDYSQCRVDGRRGALVLVTELGGEVRNGQPLQGTGHHRIEDEEEQRRREEQDRPKMAAENLPLIPAGSFSGLESEKASDFVGKFELAATSNNWAEGTKLRLLPAHLAGSALLWYSYYVKKLGNVQPTWAELTAELLRTFTPLAQADNLHLVMEKRVQRQDETAMNYFLDVLSTCKCYDRNITDQRVIQYIIQGLKPKLAEKILAMTNGSLGELEGNLKVGEVQLLRQDQNLEKYRRVTEEAVELGRGHREGLPDGGVLSDIRILASLIANMTMGGGDGRSGGRDGRRGRSRSREEEWGRRQGDETGRRSDRYDSAGRLWSGERRGDDGWRSRTPEGGVRNRSGSRGMYGGEGGGRDRSSSRSSRLGSMERRVGFQDGRYQREGGDRWQLDRFCTICRSKTHDTARCWRLRDEGWPVTSQGAGTDRNFPQGSNGSYGTPGTGGPQRGRGPFCSFCRVVDHTVVNCPKLKYNPLNQTKN